MRILGLLLMLLPVLAPPAAEKPADERGRAFAVPRPGHELRFPRDHGSHPDFQTEWWYVVGQVRTEDGRAFAFKTTFFRYVAVPPEGEPLPINMAHAAFVDVANGRAWHQERLNRDGWDAHAATDGLDLRNGNWSLRREEGETMRLRSTVEARARVDLRLQPRKGPVIFGEDGVSQQGPAPREASYYITYPRLQIAGSVQLGTERFQVSGEGWMDHEISSSQIGEHLAGWDWTGMRLADDTEIMLYILRRKDGGVDRFSSLFWVLPDGEIVKQAATAFSWEVRERWRSPHTGAEYPARIRLRARHPRTGRAHVYTIVPVIADQEIVGRIAGVSYYEGACRVLDPAGKPVGQAFLELTGYAPDQQGGFF